MVEKVEVLDENDNLIALFTKDDENDLNRMIDPTVNLLQNGDCTFTFQIALASEKWEQIKSVENFYKINGRVFSPKFDGSYTKTVSSDNQTLMSVTCYERQKLLERQYVRAWNSTTGFEKIDDFMVVILSGGNEPLKNDEAEVNPTYTIGTAGYILEGLLYNTDWSVGTVDVEGSFDFETDQTDVYNNILQLRELFGGILVFDSLNKTISLRDELKFRNYRGYEVRYTKNMESSSSIYNNKIITRVVPLGEAGLNIKSVNNGLIYLENLDYSSVVTTEIINNDSIYEPEQLKKWGERMLKDMSKPRKELTAVLKDLRKVEGHELEEFDLNDIVDVIDYGYEDGYVEQLRVISWQYKVFAIYDSVIELGDTTLNTIDIFRKISNATNDLYNGTINAGKVVSNKTGKTLENSIISNSVSFSEFKTNQEEINGGYSESISKIDGVIETATGDITILKETTAEIQTTVDYISQSIKIIGGINLVTNSVGLYGDDQYKIEGGTISEAYFGEDALLKLLTDSGAKVQPSNNQSITHQNIGLTIGKVYTLTMKISNIASNRLIFSMAGTEPVYRAGTSDEKDFISNTNGIVTIVDTTAAKDLQEITYRFKVTGEVTYTIRNEYADNTKYGFYTDLIIREGTVRSNWESAKNEIIGTALTLYYNGIEVTSVGSNIKTIINNTGFSIVDLTSITNILLTLNNKEIFLGTDTKIDGTLTIVEFTYQDFVIDGDDILMLV